MFGKQLDELTNPRTRWAATVSADGLRQQVSDLRRRATAKPSSADVGRNAVPSKTISVRSLVKSPLLNSVTI